MVLIFMRVGPVGAGRASSERNEGRGRPQWIRPLPPYVMSYLRGGRVTSLEKLPLMEKRTPISVPSLSLPKLRPHE